MKETRAGRRDAGFTLIELVLSVSILVIGILGLATATASMTKYQSLSAARAEMTLLADGKLEQLRAAAANKSADTVQLAIGGLLITPVAPHTDIVVGPSGRSYVRLWQVTLGPAATRSITLRIKPQVDVAQTPAQIDFTTLIVML